MLKQDHILDRHAVLCHFFIKQLQSCFSYGVVPFLKVDKKCLQAGNICPLHTEIIIFRLLSYDVFLLDTKVAMTCVGLTCWM
jgi:hypothetical protein